ncbi:TPA: NlpC/P60 family protein [Clostridioides difficile]|uniref:C40 family peptidase n=6 Tax=Clostridioides difficile TaxID=1496 RepID=UPI001F41903D|nr:NlpC/P60 family protein [Clostridioides difficile]
MILINNIKLQVHIKDGAIYNITDIVEKVTWSGDYKSPSRTLEFSIVQSASDINFMQIDIPVASTVCFYVDDKEIYRGMIINRSKDSSNNSISFVSKDMGFLLTQSEVSYNFKDKLVEDIAKQVFNDNKLAIGNIPKTNVKYTKMFIGVTGYDTIMSAYTEASKTTKKKYMIEANIDKFNVIEKGTITLNVMFEEGSNLINTSFSESMENVKNKVLVVDQYGNKISEKVDDKIFKDVGVIMQKVIQQQENSTVDIESEFKGIEQTCSLKGYGDVTCITGRGVKVKDSYTGLVGLFYIDTDKHTWDSNGNYEIDLDLNFQNIMDEKTAGQDEQKESSGLNGEGTLNGKEVKAEFTAYYPSDNPMEGGYYQAMDGKRLVPSNNTCAAPSQLKFKTKIQAKCAGTKIDGKTYTVTDRGGVIKVVNGVYKIDILMSSEKECYDFGRRKGTIIIGDGTGYTNATGKAGTVIAEAKKHLGKPYKWGGNGPSNFDCSGLMVYCFKKVNVNLPRTSRQQATKGKKVEKNNLQAGDLIFFKNPISHVALYIGNGEFIEAPETGKNVRIRKLSSRKDFNTARRVL